VLSQTFSGFEHSIKIYPNPAKKEIFISAKNGVVINEVTIYNQLGQKVLHEEKSTFAIDVSTLSPGIYIIELASNILSISKKLIIEKQKNRLVYYYSPKNKTVFNFHFYKIYSCLKRSCIN